ncbi:hypothetical protein, variant 1 [Aphanomyces astaci]|uniref:SAM domain-containing protein n=1 Tax=Aphanomyces astaci TaxID=112090 RepID=W4FN18_APHAT|nr:hypothetical protein, variant 1 [Aphanomyces astaci]ETV68224.1 hypothetical protein, variant 1 [Aphanomyces astaci]|eukprot:XP_009842310.1 hypothetical protein, variant 1 [Aphanomyces astaci]
MAATHVHSTHVGPTRTIRQSYQRPVAEWTVHDVVTWLHQTQLGSHEAAFRQAQATGEYLLQLTANNLTTLGITSLKQRKELMKAIHALQEDAHRRRCAQEKVPSVVEPETAEFNEVESHQSFLEALHHWRGNTPSELAHVATETTPRPTSSTAKVCWQCFQSLKTSVFRKDGHTFCSLQCEAAHVTDTQREKLAAKAVQSTATLHHQHVQSIWALDIKLS